MGKKRLARHLSAKWDADLPQTRKKAFYLAKHAENNDKKQRSRPVIADKQARPCVANGVLRERRVIMPLKKALRGSAQAILQQVLYYNLL
ncbi:hypothetical protein [Agathobaculum sp. Marseille-P7918]|uniref:hypothetical protein n=1 Tax=Agathobaculum sp. Marseille-P7918 TaxID=2479843 RepID=UPI000F63C7BF|nr:hypothetical protein [Agathobaculum sp. Marseille-P7918]